MASGPPPIVISGGAASNKPKKKPKTPAQKAAESQQTAAAKAKLKAQQGNPYDPFVTIGKGGKLVTTDAKHALHVHGQPVTRSQALSAWQKYNDLWLAYLGRPVTAKEFQSFVNKGWSQYQIINNYLVHRPNFTKSPIWKQRSGDYMDVWHQLYGENSNPDQNALKYAIVNGLSQGAFADMLRKRPDYLKSNEFQTTFSQLSTVYTKIYGIPDAKGDAILKQATLGGWSPDQLAQWLRHQPEYGHSEEFQSKALGVANALMGVTGGFPTLKPGPPIVSPFQGKPEALPADQRAPQVVGGPTAPTQLDVTTAPPTSAFGG